MATEITVTLEACAVEELWKDPTPEGIWLRRLPVTYMWDEVEIRGDVDDVWNFVELHWDAEIANDIVSSRVLA